MVLPGRSLLNLRHFLLSRLIANYLKKPADADLHRSTIIGPAVTLQNLLLSVAIFGALTCAGVMTVRLTEGLIPLDGYQGRSAIGYGLVILISASLALLVHSRMRRDSELTWAYKETAERVEENEVAAAVDEVARIVTSTLHIEEVYPQFCTELNRLVESDRIAIIRADEEAGTMEFKYVYGHRSAKHVPGNVLPLDHTRTKEVVETGTTHLWEDTDADGQFRIGHEPPDRELRAGLTTPLFFKGQAIGVLNLRSKREGVYGLRERAIAERLANQIAPAIRNAELYEESKRIEGELRLSEARARTLLESAPQGIIVTNQIGQIEQVNDAALEIFGYRREELLGQNVDILLPPDSRPDHARQRDTYFSSPEVRPMGGGRQLLGLKKCGTVIPLEIGLSHVRTESGTVALAFISDISEQVQAQESARRWTEEAVVMAEIGRIISSSLNINELYDQLGEAISKLIPSDRIHLGLVDYESRATSPVWQVGVDLPGIRVGDKIPLEGALAGEVVMTRSPILLEPGTAADLEHRYPHLMASYIAGLRSFIAVPLIDHDIVIGVLQIRSREIHIYTQRHLDLAERIANQISGAITNSQLYSERVKAEEAMRVSEQKYRLLVNESPDMIFVSRIDNFRFVEVNDRACEHFGYSNEEFLRMEIFDLEVEPPLREEVRSLYDNTQIGHVVEIYGTNRRKDGTDFPVHVRFAKLDNDFAIANVRDITRQKEADEVRQQWADESLAMAELGRIMGSSVDITEITHEIGEYMRRLVPFDRWSLTLIDHELSIATPQWGNTSDVPGHENGESFPIAGSLVEQILKSKSTIQVDVRSESDVLSSYPKLLNSFRAGIRCFLAVPLIYRGDVIGALVLRSIEPGTYTPSLIRLSERISNQIAGAIARSRLYMDRMKTEQELQNANESLEKKVDDRTLELKASYQNLQREVTERLQAEQELRDSEERFRQISENMREVIFLVDNQDYKVLYVNSAFEEIWGQPCDRLYENPMLWLDAVHPDDRTIVEDASDKQRITNEFEAEFRIIRPDGSTRWIFARAFPIRNGEGGADRLLGIAEDITERKQTEERLRETARLASVGELAAGVAHEINNPLTSVLGFSDLVLNNDLPENISNDIKTIHSEAQRAAKIVQNLLFFARKRSAEKQYLSVNSVLTRSLEMKSYDFTVSNIEVLSKLSPKIRKTMVDEHQLVQVFLNLLTNAEQAMKDKSGKGRIVVSTAMCGDKIEVTITDDGPGIPQDALHSIFEPFFTTKDVGQGTGLGLSISYGIIKQHGGEIRAENNRSEGASFKITLPEVTPEETESSAMPTSNSVSDITKHILVVDDEPNIRDLLKRFLEGRYTVDLAHNGQEAWRKMQSVHYDCALIDLKMPGMSGIELFELTQGISDTLASRVVFVTGDTVNSGTRDFIAKTGNPVVAKPFSVEDLLLSIQMVI